MARFGLSPRAMRSWLLPAVVILGALKFGASLEPIHRLGLATVGLYVAFKISVLLQDRVDSLPRLTIGELLAYGGWPGLETNPFRKREPERPDVGRRFSIGAWLFIAGIAGLVLVAWHLPGIPPGLVPWLAVACLLCAIHLGLSDVLYAVMQSAGFAARRTFDTPWRSITLSEFWSKRWNRPFVELSRRFVLPFVPCRVGARKAVFAAFLTSGLLHEFAISYPAGAGWGGPTLYFALQGVLTLMERRLRAGGPLWVGACVLLPLPLLFHAPFMEAFLRPMASGLNSALHSVHVDQAIQALLISLALAQFAALIASVQVPSRLRWKEELPQLSPLNRKLMWTYGAFIVLTILTWGVLTLVLRDEIVAGTLTGVAVMVAILAFWGLRFLVARFYLRPEDWPSGPFLTVGRHALDLLFTFILVGFGGLLAWHAVA